MATEKCIFGGIIDSGDKDHLFTTDDPVMVTTLGLGSFTLGDLRQALDTRIPTFPNVWPDLIGSAGGTDSVMKLLMDSWTSSLFFEEFDERTGEYKEKEIGGSGGDYQIPVGDGGEGLANQENLYGLRGDLVVKQIILLNQSLWAGTFDGDGWDNYTKEEATKLIDTIQASPNGCLEFESKFKYNFSVEGRTSSGCVKDVIPTFKLYLYDREYEKPGPHKLVSMDVPIIAAPATIPSRQKVGAPKSKLDVGEQPRPGTGGKENITVGELEVTFEPNTGKWESGTTNILARLLTDLPAVTVNPIDPGSVDVQKVEEYTNPESPTFFGNWEGGWALPLMVHKGNPNLFTPTWVDKKHAGEKKHKIQVVNRAGRNFAAGDLVMCFRIGGHWYVMDFGSDVGGSKGVFKIGKWSFMNMIAERRSLFRDNRYYQKLVAGEIPDAQYSNIVSPDSYESFFRENWFYQMSKSATDFWENDFVEIAAWNVGNGDDTYFSGDVGKAARDFHSCLGGYYQQTSFDLLDEKLGGTHHYGNMIGRTHMFHKPDGTQEVSDFGVPKDQFFPFWGATFPDGYAAEKITTLRNSPEASKMEPYGFGAANHLISEHHKKVTGMFDNTVNKNNDWGPWSNLQDKNGVQLPADVALLASPSGENGYGMESFSRIKDYCSFGPGPAGGELYLHQNTQVYNYPNKNGLGSKFNWLTIHDGSVGGDEGREKGILPSLYDFKPISPHRVEFKPLWADYLGSLDRSATANEDGSCLPPRSEEQYYDQSRLHFPGVVEGGSFHEGIIGTAFCKRIENGNFIDSVNQTKGWDGLCSPTAAWRGVPYGRMVGGGTIPNQRYGSESNGGNIVGMTIAKAKVSVKATELTFTTTQWLGLSNVKTAAGGGGFVFGGFGMIGFIVPTGPGAHSNSYPQWGRNSDNPWQGGAFGTTALHGRLCDQWPDEQTILDPRYFAVMHFNPQGGVYLKSWDGVADTVEFPTWVMHKEEFKELGDAKVEAGWKKGEKFPDFRHPKGISYTDVDLKMPTFVTDDSNTSLMATEGDYITGDNYRGEGSVFLDTSYWIINPIRRGKLLPFTYPKMVISCSIDDSPNTTGARSMGKNFTVGDKLTTSGGHGYGVELEVTSVSAADATPPGAIEDWEFTKDELGNPNKGEGFLPQDFPTADTHPTAEGGQEGSVTLVKKTGSGEDLEYTYNREPNNWVTGILYGKIVKKKGKDAGPNKGTVIKQLSLPSNPPAGNGDGGNGRCIGQAKNGISLDAAHDGAYDLFLLFHSDVQHYLRNYITFSNNAAQYCTLEISTAN